MDSYKIFSTTESFSWIYYKLEETKPPGSNCGKLVYLRHQCNDSPLWDDDPVKAHWPNHGHRNKTHRDSDYPEPTMMLLMGIKMSLTKNPMKPITTNPSAVLIDTFENSVHQATSNNNKTTSIHCFPDLAKLGFIHLFSTQTGYTNPITLESSTLLLTEAGDHQDSLSMPSGLQHHEEQWYEQISKVNRKK